MTEERKNRSKRETALGEESLSCGWGLREAGVGVGSKESREIKCAVQLAWVGGLWLFRKMS